MKYKCPSCKMRSEDSTPPLELLTQPLCVFCSSSHTQKELLNWRMDHIDSIDREDLGTVLRNFYRYVESEINHLKEQLHDCTDRRGNSP